GSPQCTFYGYYNLKQKMLSFDNDLLYNGKVVEVEHSVTLKNVETIKSQKGRALMNSKKHEIKFRVNYEKVTFAAANGFDMPKDYENTLVIDNPKVDIIQMIRSRR
ncbi:hypothetical protein HAX54_043981, partial [Datura stramonium]|nr:hypothetical protein [Datura stramonium]